MNNSKLTNFPKRFGLAAALVVLACAPQGYQVFAQKSPAATQNPSDDKAPPPAPAAGQAQEDDQLFKDIYKDFYNTYRLGPADEIAIRVTGQPDYTLERVKVSPTGLVYHPLLGDLEVAGLTVPRLLERLTKDLSEFLIDPKVSVALIEAHSAKIGVLGDVVKPGILVMDRPMNVLEAITEAGGFADTGSKSGVTVLRQARDGRGLTLKVNLKLVLEGKAGAEENIPLQPGDIVLIPGNTKKKMETISSLAGFGSFLSFIT
ncbi:MAG: polysaccharide export protein, partial [Blastocatellia bacterium]|nr:polysaccharide export protein [Blastocatellia bacterium]